MNGVIICCITCTKCNMTFLSPVVAPKPREASRPVYGCQVIVQTESEKKLSKLYRKEEKKMAKKQEDEQEVLCNILGFDPQELKAKR